jgi:hypothetical protein
VFHPCFSQTIGIAKKIRVPEKKNPIAEEKNDFLAVFRFVLFGGDEEDNPYLLNAIQSLSQPS